MWLFDYTKQFLMATKDWIGLDELDNQNSNLASRKDRQRKFWYGCR